MKRETARNIKRRTFIKAGAAVVAGAATLPGTSLAAESAATVVVVHGTDIAKMVEAGIAKMGGWDKFFKPGGKVALKPNLAWKSTPEQGGNTHPDILRAVVLAAEARKVRKITIPENTCQPEKETFETSGANGALKGTGAKLYRPKRGDFTSVSVPKGKVCQEAKVRAWHRNGLHQCIADFSTYLKPTLIVIDATRIMLDHGPQGPGKLAHPNEIIFATDPVAADTYAASLFGKKPEDVPHIKIAAELGVGCADLAKIKVERVEA